MSERDLIERLRNPEKVHLKFCATFITIDAEKDMKTAADRLEAFATAAKEAATTIARLSEALAEAEKKGAEEAERQSAYYGALVLCLDRYEEMASKAHLDRLVEFITEFQEAISDRAPLCKLNRWLGYIQGTLISEEVTSVEAERDWTRRLFRPLDFPTPPRDLSQGGQHG